MVGPCFQLEAPVKEKIADAAEEVLLWVKKTAAQAAATVKTTNALAANLLINLGFFFCFIFLF